MGNTYSKMSDCDCDLDRDVRGRCDTENMACKVRDDSLLFQIKNDYDLMHSTQITQLTWLLDKGVSQEAVVKFFEDTT